MYCLCEMIFFLFVSWLLLWYFHILLVTPVSCLKKYSESSALSDPIPAGIRSRPWQHVAGMNRTCSPSVSGAVFHWNEALKLCWCPSGIPGCASQKGSCLWAHFWFLRPALLRPQKAEALVLSSFHFLAWISSHGYQNSTQTPAFLLQSLFGLTSNKALLLEIGVC